MKLCPRSHMRVLCSEFANLFARCQHLYDIAAKPINTDSNILSYPAPFFLF